MEKNLLSKDAYYIKVGVEFGINPLNWLRHFYEEYEGKLVLIDDELFTQLLNKGSMDEVIVTGDDYQKTYDLVWKNGGTDAYFHVYIDSYGSSDEYFDEYEQKYKIAEKNTNWHFISKITPKGLVSDTQIGENGAEDPQIVFLTSIQAQNEHEYIR